MKKGWISLLLCGLLIGGAGCNLKMSENYYILCLYNGQAASAEASTGHQICGFRVKYATKEMVLLDGSGTADGEDFSLDFQVEKTILLSAEPEPSAYRFYYTNDKDAFPETWSAMIDAQSRKETFWQSNSSIEAFKSERYDELAVRRIAQELESSGIVSDDYADEATAWWGYYLSALWMNAQEPEAIEEVNVFTENAFNGREYYIEIVTETNLRYTIYDEGFVLCNGSKFDVRLD